MEITPEHLKLLERLQWEFDDREFGAPGVDCKRPYGNSDVEFDIARILGWEFFEDEYGETHLSKEHYNKAVKIHGELLEVIKQIIGEYIEKHR